MRIVKAPLLEEEYRTILTEYNRLTQAKIPMNEFRHWALNSPEGPAWHALLHTSEGRVVGHTSVLPIRARHREKYLKAGMSEYSFLHEDFRKLKICGFENVSRPAFIILLDQLFQHCQKEGWGPIFASTNEKNQVFTRKVGLRPAEFPLKECLLVLKPSNATRYTPNLSQKQQAALFLTGLAQAGLWSVAKHFGSKSNGIHPVPIGAETVWPETDRLSFYEEQDSVQWRYLADQYVQYVNDREPQDYVITKCGREDRYLRVCQYRLKSADSVDSVFHALLAQAGKEKAIGIRWAVYDDGELSEKIVNKLRRRGFLCAHRVRIVMVHKDFPEYLEPAAWKMTDAHFSLDP